MNNIPRIDKVENSIQSIPQEVPLECYKYPISFLWKSSYTGIPEQAERKYRPAGNSMHVSRSVVPSEDLVVLSARSLR